jgi:cation:H+ antiporter
VVLAVLLLLAGAALLVGGAETFAEHAVVAGRRLRLHAATLALLVAGAEPEEAVVASIAASQGRGDLAVGDAVGANVVIATLALGLAGVVTPWPVTRRVRVFAAVATAAGLLSLLAMLAGDVGRLGGALLLWAYVVAVVLLWRHGAVVTAAEGEPGTGTGAVGRVIVGVVAMAAGGTLAVDGAVRLAAQTGIDDGVVGLTVLALATSAEMLVLVWSAHRRALRDVAVAAALGAVFFNATATLGIAAIVQPLQLDDRAPLLVFGTVAAAAPLALASGLLTRVGRVAGALLVLGYLAANYWLLLGS